MTTSLNGLDLQASRDAIAASLPADTSSPLPDQQLFLPWPHRKALELECSLVIGERGAGKTAWATALLNQTHQSSEALPQAIFPYSLRTIAGYSDQGHPSHPPPGVFAELMRDQADPYNLWLAVVLRSLTSSSTSLPMDSWAATLAWVREHLEEAWALLRQEDRALQESNTGLLFVFDALDRVNTDWSDVSDAIRALLRLVLDLKIFKRVHTKVFLRTDQYTRNSFADLPDIAKIRATRVELRWSLIDLHALLWQCLCNGSPSQARDDFRSLCLTVSEPPLFRGRGDLFSASPNSIRWELPVPVQQGEPVQRQLFECLAGRRMGRGEKSGVPYTWIVNHLADAQGKTMPRSFLTAMRIAADETRHRFFDAEHILHYDGLKYGVHAASDNRIAELQEDYRWLPNLMEPFRGSSVPLSEDTFAHVLNDTFGSIPEGVPHLAEGLPNELRHQGVVGLTTYLVQLGVLTQMQDHRLNMPDIYRIGFKLGRKGGLKPVPRTLAQTE
jgi:hypothetical protein